MIIVNVYNCVIGTVDEIPSDFSPETKLLTIMLGKEKIIRSDFTKVYGMNYITAKNALERLERMGLTKYMALGDRRDTVYWSLTPKGEKAAEMLVELDEFIRRE